MVGMGDGPEAWKVAEGLGPAHLYWRGERGFSIAELGSVGPLAGVAEVVVGLATQVAAESVWPIVVYRPVLAAAPVVVPLLSADGEWPRALHYLERWPDVGCGLYWLLPKRPVRH